MNYLTKKYILKAVSWKLLSLVVVVLLTKSFKISALYLAITIVLYILHECFWHRFKNKLR